MLVLSRGNISSFLASILADAKIVIEKPEVVIVSDKNDEAIAELKSRTRVLEELIVFQGLQSKALIVNLTEQANTQRNAVADLESRQESSTETILDLKEQMRDMEIQQEALNGTNLDLKEQLSKTSQAKQPCRGISDPFRDSSPFVIEVDTSRCSFSSGSHPM